MNWKQEGSVDDGDFLIYDEKIDEEVIEIRNGFISKRYLDLILAAPDLLDALIACNDAMEYMSEYDIPVYLPQQVKDAIAKATGENNG
jgi:hypothetical protein